MGPRQRPHRSDGGSAVERSVAIRGDGVAATCAAHLLAERGYRIQWDRTGRSRVPAIMLSESAVALTRDVFNQPELFRRAHCIHRREVAWRPGDAPAVFEHSAIVVSEEDLLSELPEPPTSAAASGQTLIATQPPAAKQPFGSRIASATHVTLESAADSAACCIESFPEGWLFLVPNSSGSAWLLSVGGEHLPYSRLIAPRIQSTAPAAGNFPAYPAIAQSLVGPRWLAFGSAAMAFDPICGDGTAHAIREAVLASACIGAIDEGEPEPAVQAHYQSRMILGFRRHLALVVSFYRSGHGGPWWDAEAEAANRGIAWCDERIAAFGPTRYRLEGAELICPRS